MTDEVRGLPARDDYYLALAFTAFGVDSAEAKRKKKKQAAAETKKPEDAGSKGGELGREHTTIMAAYLVLIALFFVIINLIVDLLYHVVDPRLRVEGRSAHG